MNQINTERRNTPRIAFRIPMVVIGMNKKAKATDFSLGGFFIKMEAADELRKGQFVRLAMRFPHEKHSTIIKAMVTRIEKDGFGCRFVELTPLVRQLLETNFNLFSATLPIE